MSASTKSVKGPQALRRTEDQLGSVALLPDMAGGVVVGIIQVSTCLSCAAMIFAGSLEPWVVLGISGMLAGGVIHNLFAAFWSSGPGITFPA